MPRYRRQIPAGSVQHIISRFVNREFRFDSGAGSPRDPRQEYLGRAARVLPRSDWNALAFALMSSHVHWAMRAGENPSSTIVKPLHTGFAGWLNFIDRRLGPVFADRHRNVTFEGESAAPLLAYIHNNPVRAGVVRDPADSDWTSHRAYLGLAPAPPWLDVHLGLHLCGFEATASGRLRFHEMVLAHRGDPKRIELSGGDMQAQRRAVRKTLCSPVEISSPTVTLGGRRSHSEVTAQLPANWQPRRVWTGSVDELLREVALWTNITVDEMCSRNRTRSVVNARRLAMIAWTRELHRPAIELGRVFGLTTSTTTSLVANAPSRTLADAAALATSLRECRAA